MLLGQALIEIALDDKKIPAQLASLKNQVEKGLSALANKNLRIGIDKGAEDGLKRISKSVDAVYNRWLDHTKRVDTANARNVQALTATQTALSKTKSSIHNLSDSWRSSETAARKYAQMQIDAATENERRIRESGVLQARALEENEKRIRQRALLEAQAYEENIRRDRQLNAMRSAALKENEMFDRKREQSIRKMAVLQAEAIKENEKFNRSQRKDVQIGKTGIMESQLASRWKESGETIRRFSALQSEAAKENKRLSQQFVEGEKAADGFGKTIGRISRTIVAFATVAATIKTIDLFGRLIGTGIEYNKQIENSRLGISALLATHGKFVDLKGKELEGQEKINAAYSMTDQLIKRLEVDNIRTTATFSQLVKVFQQGIAFGPSTGMNPDQIRQISVGVVQAASALQMDLNMLNEEMRSLMTGNINSRSSFIATALGIRPEDIKKYKGDAEGLFNFLNKKLAEFREFSFESQNTYTGLFSNLQDMLSKAMGVGTRPFFDSLKGAIREIYNYIGQVNERTGELELNPNFLDKIKVLNRMLEDALNVLKGMAKALIDLDVRNLERIVIHIENLARVANSLPNGSIGLLAAILFGRTAAGPLLLLNSAYDILQNINTVLDKISGTKTPGILETLDNLIGKEGSLTKIAEVMQGKRDASTGAELPNLPPLDEFNPNNPNFLKTKYLDFSKPGTHAYQKNKIPPTYIQNKGRQDEDKTKGFLSASDVDQMLETLKSKSTDVFQKMANEADDAKIRMLEASGQYYEAELERIDKLARNRKTDFQQMVDSAEKSYNEMQQKVEKADAKGKATPEAKALLAEAKDRWLYLKKYAGAYADTVDRVVEVEKKFAAIIKQTAERDIAQLNLEYAEMTKSLQDQLVLKIKLLEKERELAKAQNPQLSEYYDRNYEEKIRREELMGSDDFFGGFGQSAKDWANTIPTGAMRGAEAFKMFTDSIEGAAEALTNFIMTGKMEFGDFVRSIIAGLIKIQIQTAMTQLFGSVIQGGLGGLFSGGSSSGFTSAGGVSWNPSLNFPEHRAAGGPIIPYKPYIVGEKGPELFMSGNSGTIVPNDHLVTRENISIPISVSVTAPPSSGDSDKDKKYSEMFGQQVGRAIESKVEEKLRKELRPGGMLNPGKRVA
jgi:lambda family phage tail tape measure protein